jgi:hypothetical protein
MLGSSVHEAPLTNTANDTHTKACIACSRTKYNHTRVYTHVCVLVGACTSRYVSFATRIHTELRTATATTVRRN